MTPDRTLAGRTVGATGTRIALPAVADDHTATVSVLHAVPVDDAVVVPEPLP